MLPLYAAYASMSALSAPLPTLVSKTATLAFTTTAGGGYGVGLSLGAATAAFVQGKPVAVEVVDQTGTAVWVEAAYDSVQDAGSQGIRCTGQVVSAKGSIFTITDTYSLGPDESTFTVDRKAIVNVAHAADIGFSTRLAFRSAVDLAMRECDFFAPAVWYKDNADAPANALARDYTDSEYWIREDRLPLPLFMLRRKSDGLVFSVFHRDADGATFKSEGGLNRVIDGRMLFASLGMENTGRPLVGILFPGSEGERTGVAGYAAGKRWALRSHPVSKGFTQSYRMAFRISTEPDFPTALRTTWTAYRSIQKPARYACDLAAVYGQQIGILDRYWKSINGAAGVPFRILLNGQVEAESDYNFNLGFVGQQPGSAALLIREGIQGKRPDLVAKGEQMADFWGRNLIGPAGCPRVWYDPIPRTWRGGTAYLRQVGDGVRGLLWAWSLEKRAGIDKPEWLAACVKTGDWAAALQNGDGSFPRGYDQAGGAVTLLEKTTTSHIIPFLVELHLATGADKYRSMALRSGEYLYTEVHGNYRYVGGAIDHPNVPDKEAASMALRAFLALYDLNKDPRWLQAALRAAYYYATWVYAWNVPVPQDDAAALFPFRRSTTGMSVIATGGNGSDTYAAIDAFNFFRLYLYSEDPLLLETAESLLYDTKQYMNWDPVRDPIPGFATGFLGEAMSVTIPRGHGVGYFLPWQTYNLMEPMAYLRDAFGAEGYAIESLLAGASLKELQARNENFSRDRLVFPSNGIAIRAMGKRVSARGLDARRKGYTADGRRIRSRGMDISPYISPYISR